MQKRNPVLRSSWTIKLFYVADRLLGKEGKKKLYDHLRDAKGRVPVAAFGAAIGELIRSFSAGKNSASSPN